MKKVLSLLLLLIACANLTAQQTSLNTLYNQNQYLINPAAAGYDPCFKAYLGHRNQWVGINESPIRNFITLDGRLGKNHGLGLNIQHFQAGLLSNFDAKLSYAYHFSLGENSSLSLGISAGMIQQRFAISDAIASDYDDNTLLQGNQSDIGFTSEAGIMLRLKRLQLGFSVPQIFASGVQINQGSSTEQDFRLVRHFNAFASYDLISSDNWKLNPFVLYRNALFIGHQVDAGARVAWKNILGVGAMYRTSYGMAAMADINIGDKFRLAYSYGFGSTNNITGISKGTHEIMIGLKICRKPKEEPIDIVQDSIPSDTLQIVEEDPIELIDTVEVSDPIVQDPVVEDSVTETTIVEPKLLDLDSLNRAFADFDRLLLFKLNSATTVTSDNEKKILSSVVDILKEYDDLNVVLEGHSCNRGEAERNMTLSERRALDIKNLLVKAGIKESRIATSGKGETQPLFPNTSDENQKKNRRVQFVFRR